MLCTGRTALQGVSMRVEKLTLEQSMIRECTEHPEQPIHLAAYHDWLLDEGRGADAAAIQHMMSDLKPLEKFSDLHGRILVSVDVPESRGEIIFTTIRG